MSKKYIVLSIALFISTLGYSQKLTGFDEQIKNGVDSILQDYTKYSSFSLDGASINPVYIERYINLFHDGAKSNVLNDIKPNQEEQQLVSVQEYTDFARNNYKGGLSISLQSEKAVISEAYTFKKSKNYIVNVQVFKKIFGLFQGKKILDVTKDLTIQVVFDTKSGAPSNFKIFEINTADAVYDITSSKEEKLAYGIVVTPGYGQITSQNMSSDNNWKSKGDMAIGAGVEISYQFNLGMSIVSGIHYSSLKTTNTVSIQNFRSSTSMLDADNDTYFKEIDAELEEVNTLAFIELPILFKYTLKPEAKISYYAFAGVSVAYMLSSDYKVDGTATQRGYYPDYNVTLENLEEYGFTSNSYQSISGNWILNELNFFGNAGVGVSFKTGYKSRLNIAPVF